MKYAGGHYPEGKPHPEEVGIYKFPMTGEIYTNRNLVFKDN